MKKVPLFVYLLFIFIVVFLYGEDLPLAYKEVLLALSETLKSLLVFVLPIILFSCLFSSMLAFKKRAFLFVLGFLSFICLSNYITSLIGFGIGLSASHFLNHLSQIAPSVEKTLEPTWHLPLREWLDNRYALGLGLIGGLLATRSPYPIIKDWADRLNEIVHLFLKKVFLPFMPLFVLGFVVKMQHEGLLTPIFKAYLPILVLMTLSLVFYLFLLFLAAARFNLHEALTYIRRATPAGLLGFSSLSSMAALPLNLDAAERSAPHPCAARAIVPATVNSHLIGDSLAVPIIAVAVLLTFKVPLPSLWTFAIFGIFLMLTKFSIVALPAGGVIVLMTPLSTYLDFSGEMIALLIAVYLLFEPILTCANVMGNNATAILLSRFTGQLKD